MPLMGLFSISFNVYDLAKHNSPYWERAAKPSPIFMSGTWLMPFCYFRNVANNAYHVFNIGVDSATAVTIIAHIVTEEMNLPDVNFNYTGGNVRWKGDVPRFSYDNRRLRGLGWKRAVESDEAVRLVTRAILSGAKD
jgi:nucleoside-diphosphate-sugar epimerase